MSKTRHQITLSAEATELLEEQPNKSLYIEQLILGKVEQKVPWRNLEFKLDELKGLLQADTSASKPDDEGSSPSSSAIKLPNCCTTQDKCVHWSYDELNQQYTHRITGEVKEAV